MAAALTTSSTEPKATKWQQGLRPPLEPLGDNKASRLSGKSRNLAGLIVGLLELSAKEVPCCMDTVLGLPSSRARRCSTNWAFEARSTSTPSEDLAVSLLSSACIMKLALKLFFLLLIKSCLRRSRRH
jgi:hypothetical protein